VSWLPQPTEDGTLALAVNLDVLELGGVPSVTDAWQITIDRSR
jgi:hypothetical protein